MAHLLGRLQEVRRESVRMEPNHHSPKRPKRLGPFES